MSRLAKTYFILWGAFFLLAVLDFSFLESFKELIGIVLFILTVYYAAKIGRSLARRLLWRIRRKLILSYIFIGFIPICLLLVLFLLGSSIFMGQATSEMFYSSLEGYVFHAKIESEKLLHLTEFLQPYSAVERWTRELQEEDHPWLQFAEITLSTPSGNSLLNGKTPHDFPEWVNGKEFSGVVMREGLPWIATVHHDPGSQRSINLLVPVSKPLLDLIRKKTNADIQYIPFAQGQSAQNELKETLATTRKQPIWPVWWDFPVWWLSLPDQYDWETGKQIKIIQVSQDSDSNTSPFLVLDDESKKDVTERAPTIGAFWVSTNVSRVYNHIFARSTSLQKFVYVLMIAVAVFFLIIELISLISGFLLARSITASVHNLFEGTEKIKSGDLSYRIKVTAHDQLGELAASFNNMTESIQNLLVERSEKERLAESLRIARQMQEKLLPQKITSASAQMEIATLNLPAEEVCGDYYDIIQKSQHETGVIIADVSGKGPSAALYMAEVKGVMMSLSRRTIVPKEVLLEANGILGPTLDSRNFITMTYALIDDADRTMRISRAGHNPILHYCAATGDIEIVQPAGIGLGLGKNGVFEKALEEVKRSLGIGDILVFYTDGLTEAMNEQNQLFGLSRLSQIILLHREDGTEEIKNAVLTDLQQFLNHKLPQDDITLVLLKMR